MKSTIQEITRSAPPAFPRFIETDLGKEKLCIHCQEYWPLDGEFWWPNGKGKNGTQLWSSVCKGCYDERYQRRRFKVKEPQS